MAVVDGPNCRISANSGRMRVAGKAAIKLSIRSEKCKSLSGKIPTAGKNCPSGTQDSRPAILLYLPFRFFEFARITHQRLPVIS